MGRHVLCCAHAAEEARAACVGVEGGAQAEVRELEMEQRDPAVAAAGAVCLGIGLRSR